MRNTDIYKGKTIKLLKKYNLYSIPVDIKELADKLNIKVNYENLDSGISGKITYNPDPDLENDVVISINNSEVELRKNFSLAHEIAHYIYDIDFSNKEMEIKDKILLRSNTINPIERRANQYAERLLMPKRLFENELYKIKDKLFPEYKNNKLGLDRIYEIIKQLSVNFQVSIPAVIMRLFSLKKISEQTKIALFKKHKN